MKPEGLARRAYDATWGRVFAACYDRCLAKTEEAGLTEMRREMLARANGRTVEIGAGTGANLEHYPPSVGEVVLTEPFPPMAQQLRARVDDPDRGGPPASVVEASAEVLPLEDEGFDTAVVTLVLCTVDDPEAALREISRVLRPGGRLLFLEHVRSSRDSLARWQDRLEAPWGFIAAGCHPNRDTVETISASALRLEAVEGSAMPKAPKIIEPLVLGSAVKEA